MYTCMLICQITEKYPSVKKKTIVDTKVVDTSTTTSYVLHDTVMIACS